MNKPLISVIVPVYNVEEYLPECIESILNQTHRDFELLLINDGSTDGSLEICERYRAQDERIRVLSQENSGVSSARNRGIDFAEGAYITFVDADDVVHQRFLEILYKGAVEGRAQMSFCTYREFSEDQVPDLADAAICADYQMITRNQAFEILNQPNTELALRLIIPCDKIYSKELFDGIRFPIGTRHEDEFIAHRIVHPCSRIVRNDSALYYYRRYSGSFMGVGEQQKDVEHLALIEALSDRIRFYDENAPEFVSAGMHRFLQACADFHDTYRKYSDEIHREKRKWLVRTYQKEYFRYFGKISNTERLKGAFFILFPHLYHSLADRRWKARQKK